MILITFGLYLISRFIFGYLLFFKTVDIIYVSIYNDTKLVLILFNGVFEMKKAKFGIREENSEQDLREDMEKKDKRPKFAKFGTQQDEPNDEEKSEPKKKFGLNEESKTEGHAAFSNFKSDSVENKSSIKSSEDFGIGEKAHETSIKDIGSQHLLSVFANQDKSFWIMYGVLSVLFFVMTNSTVGYYTQMNIFLNILRLLLFPFIFILLDRIAMFLPFLEGITKLFVFGSNSGSFFGYIKQFFGNIKQSVVSTIGRITDSWWAMILAYFMLLIFVFMAFYLLWYYCFLLGAIGLVLELIDVLRAE